jgi:hypothetical protein
MLSGCGVKPDSPPPAAAAEAKPPRADLVAIPEELKKPATLSVSQGFVDIVNEAQAFRVTDQERVFRAKTDAPLWFRGWAYDDSAKKTPTVVWIELTGKEPGRRFFIPAERVERVDVATGFKAAWAKKCGFTSAEVRDHNIPPGSYVVKIYQIDGHTAELTKYYSSPTVTVIFE